MIKKDLTEMCKTMYMDELATWVDINQHDYVLVKKDELESLEETLDKANTLLCKVYDSGIKLDELETSVHEYLVGGIDE